MSCNTTIFWGDNPSQMYLDALYQLMHNGKEYSPRGKRIKELRPVVFEYHNPLNRVTFVKGRVINPFFQLAESLWIAMGGNDVASLTPYNASISQFSDDGKTFNAPYGERLRHWGNNGFRKTIFNPIDQLRDCYEKLKADPDTRQAVAFIGNPHFDNSEYTLSGGKDIACNINIKFKIRDGKLDIVVDNRSNDLHWGVFGANLCQFSTLQELMASWLGIGVGVYYQVSDSLHVYLDDYGAKETTKIVNAYAGIEYRADNFEFEDEPRMSLNFEEFEYFSSVTFPEFKESYLGEFISKYGLKQTIDSITLGDEYLKMTLWAMFVKKCHNVRDSHSVVYGMENIKDCSWKVSLLRFLYPKYSDIVQFNDLYSHLDSSIRDYIERKDING